MTKHIDRIRLHRFHKKVAVSMGLGETVYLSHEQARELGKHLVRFTKDIGNVDFVESKLKPIVIEKDK